MPRDSHHHHLHWPSLHVHWPAHHRYTAGTAGAYVGRVGTLAVAMGIGTAAATGSCVACAYADTGEAGTSSGRSATTATSQTVSVGTRRTSRPSTVQVAPGSTRTPAAAEVVAPTAAKRRSANRHVSAEPVAPHPPGAHPLAQSEIGVELPEVAESPSGSPVVAIPQTAATEGGIRAAPTPLAPTTLLGAGQAVRPPQPVVIASPPVASASIATMVGKVLTSLSDVVSGNSPSVPADISVAMMVEAARRSERIAALGVPVAAATRQVTASATTSSTTTTTTVEAEKMTLSPSGAGRVVSDRKASGGYALALTNTGTMSTTVNLPASSGLTIRARTNAGSPTMTLSIDGVAVTTVVVKSTSWSDYTVTGALSAGPHTISLGSSTATALRTLYVDKVMTTTGPVGDEFLGKSGSAPSGIWNVISGTGWDTGVQNYTTGNATLDGQGHLVIKAVKSRSGAYTSGRVESLNNMSFGYGTITARIKVPKGQGLWPAFWLAGADGATVAWPQSGEIDVMELPSTTTTVYSTLHGPIAGSTSTQQAQIVSNLPDLSTDYHNYWVRHLENEITFGVDGITLGTLTPASLPPGATWVYNRPMQAILNLAVGGPWAGAPNGSTVFPATMTVDWVRWDSPA